MNKILIMNDQNKLYSINRLKHDFGLKPLPQAVPAEWWTHYQSGRQYPVFRIDDCVKIEEYELSEKQIRLSNISQSIH